MTCTLAAIGRRGRLDAQRAAMRAALDACGWRLTDAARSLGVQLAHMARVLRELGLYDEALTRRAALTAVAKRGDSKRAKLNRPRVAQTTGAPTEE